MAWQKLVERKGDFLKNYLLHQSFEETFPKAFGIDHCRTLTVRKWDRFSHYFDSGDTQRMFFFINEQIGKDPEFVHKLVASGEEHFKNLVTFCEKIKNPAGMSNEQQGVLLKEYFRLYKEPYPYFNLAIFGDGLEKEGQKELIEQLAAFRFFSRVQFNKAHELIRPVLEEAAKRCGLNFEELLFLTPLEIVGLMPDRSKIEKRQQCYFLFEKGKSTLKEDETTHIEEAKDEEIRGQGTFPARYKGNVRIIRNNDDLKKVEQGEILVLSMTTPDLMVEGIKKAGAIITDEGGVTCHAAVISREYKIPTLMGTKTATKILKTGDVVEIDTNTGIATKILFGI